MVIHNNKQNLFSDMEQSSVSRPLQHYNHVVGGLGFETLTFECLDRISNLDNENLDFIKILAQMRNNLIFSK
jgi:hypothetical protein